MSEHTIHLVDASPYIFRGYFSIPSKMVGQSGLPVNAVYGFTQFLLRLIEQEEVTHLGLAFDKSLTTSFRNEIYPDYKAQRELPPPALEAQLDWCQEVGEALGAAIYVDLRYEADDLVGTLCRQLEADGHELVVVTSDKDLAQLVNERVTLLDFAKDERYDAAKVEEKFGVRPEQIADYLGLAGDSVDNIPGVAGVGAKTAVALLSALGSLEAIYERLDEVPSLPIRGAKSLHKKLVDQREQAFLSRQLATIAIDAPATADLDELSLDGADPELVDPLFEELRFGRIRDRIPRWKSS
ncbi:MAG: 5'-3' exonuclease H3TH domain-containing protein [Acidobacteriota bacterium]